MSPDVLAIALQYISLICIQRRLLLWVTIIIRTSKDPIQIQCYWLCPFCLCCSERPNVKQCLAHPWLAPEEEPPSPSPLMLKIPTPDHLLEPLPKINVEHGHGGGSKGSHSGGGGPSTSRRSCQTCRDKITERKRYLSKSREAIFEKVAQSNLKKSLSKSRERLCDMRLTLSKSREYLGSNEVTKVMSRPQDKLYGFKSLSKSQEVISAALGGVPMKRMINGAVSDISHALIKQPPLQQHSELPSPSVDFIYVPGSGILVPQMELMKINSGSLQVMRSSFFDDVYFCICSVANLGFFKWLPI